jgi:hypothetical protein
MAEAGPVREATVLETQIGKAIFYLTCAVSMWFFYWFAGIQCPC